MVSLIMLRYECCCLDFLIYSKIGNAASFCQNIVDYKLLLISH